MKNQKVYLANYTLPNIFRIGPVRFVPGLNYIKQEDWEKISKHPLLPHRFKEGHIVWVKNKGPEDFIAPLNQEKLSSNDLSGQLDESADQSIAFDILDGYNSKEAIQLVKETYDFKLLGIWKERESRKGVVAVIQEQLDSLTANDSE